MLKKIAILALVPFSILQASGRNPHPAKEMGTRTFSSISFTNQPPAYVT